MASRPIRRKRGEADEPRRVGSNHGENPTLRTNVPPKRNGSEIPVRSNSARGEGPPVRGVGRNKSLPRKSSEGTEQMPKRRQARKEPAARGVGRAQSGGVELARNKGRRAPSDRAVGAGAGRTGSRNAAESPSTPSNRKGRKMATPIVGTVRAPGRAARGTARQSNEQQRARSRSADGMGPKKASLRRQVSDDSGPAAAPVRKGRRTPSGRGAPIPPSPSAPLAPGNAMASPGGAGRKARRAAPEKRGIAPSKSLPSEQIRRVERIRRGQDKAQVDHRPPMRMAADTSSSEEESSSDEASSSSESSLEPTESHRGGDFDYHDDDDSSGSVDIIAPPRNEEIHEDNQYSGHFEYDDADDISYGPPPQIGGRVVYSGGIVVEDASDSEMEFDHKKPYRNRRPDFKRGDQWLNPIGAGSGSGESKRSTEGSSNAAPPSSKKTSKATSRSNSGSDHPKTGTRAGKGGSNPNKVRRPDGRGRDAPRGQKGSGTSPKPRGGGQRDRKVRRSRSSSADRPLYDEPNRGSGGGQQRPPPARRHSPRRTHSDDDVLKGEEGNRGKRRPGAKPGRPERRGTGDHSRSAGY
ncbi:MAG: hypothetical protein SGBAC_012940 [Bacillariaceae sp.]